MFKPTANVLSRFSLLFAVTALAACGGSSGSTTTLTPVGPSGDKPEDTLSGTDDFSGNEVQGYFVGENATLKAGVFLGRVTYTDDTFIDGLMLLSATGNYNFVLDTESNVLNADIVSGTFTLDGADANASVFEYKLTDTWNRTTGNLLGSVTSDTSAVLDSGGRVVKIDITRDNNASVQSLSFTQIAGGTGIYKTTGSDSRIEIDTSGGIKGFDSGCVLEGKITIPSDEINIYELSYEASECGDLPEAKGSQRDGRYLGVGTFTPAANSEGEGDIEFAASNGKVAFYFAGTR